MELERESGWKLHPIGGETGQAYMGIKDEEKLFLKRNTSPFLAALSLEGISPRLVWTKRIGNGDVLTAQEWCNGRNLEEEEMSSSRVAKILKKVHSSTSLKRMLQRVGGRKISPQHCLEDYHLNLAPELENHPDLQEAVDLLKENQQIVSQTEEVCVCHGDVSRKNWLLSETDQLYLVDWDSAVLADPAYDIGQLCSYYIEKGSITDWLKIYGVKMTQSFKHRLRWYTIFTLLLEIKKQHRKGRFHKMNKGIITLHTWVQQWKEELADKEG